MRIRILCSAVVLVAAMELLPASAGAQQPPATSTPVQVRIGDRVRFRLVRAPGQRHMGFVEEADVEQIRVRVEGWSNSYSVRMHEFAELQVRGGNAPRGRGAVSGGLTGAVIGGILFALPKPEPGAMVGPQSRGEAAFLGAILGGLIGALVGAASPGPLWVDVPLAAPDLP